LGARPATSPRKRPNTAKNAQLLKAGPRKMQEVAEQILQTELQIHAIQEIRWKGQGQIKKDKYNLYYSCKKGQTGQPRKK
jgi:hypothetical protein